MGLLLIVSYYIIGNNAVFTENTGAFAPVILEQEPPPGNVAASPAPLIRVKFQDESQELKKAIPSNGLSAAADYPAYF